MKCHLNFKSAGFENVLEKSKLNNFRKVNISHLRNIFIFLSLKIIIKNTYWTFYILFNR